MRIRAVQADGRIPGARPGHRAARFVGADRTAPEAQAEGGKVSAVKILAIVLIAAGIIGLVYGGITYTKTTHDAKVGPISFSIKDKETINIPVWAGVGAIVVGGVLLFARSKD